MGNGRPALESDEDAMGDQVDAAAGEQQWSPAEELKKEYDLLWQRAVAKANEMANRAREAVANDNYLEARQLAETSFQTIEAAKQYADPVSRYLAERDRAMVLKQEVADANAAFDRQKAREAQEEIRIQIADREARLQREKQDKIDQLFKTAEQLRREKKYEEAALILQQVLFLDPGNATASGQLVWAQDAAAIQESRDLEDDRYREQRNALQKAEESLIPWDVEILYPKNWLELSRRRRPYRVSASGRDDEAELNNKLKESYPEFRFQNTPLEQVFTFLGDQMGVNLQVEWETLEASGVERNKEISIAMAQVSYRQILDQLLEQAGGTDVKLAFTIDKNLLRISTKEKLDRIKFVNVYDVRDLLLTVPRFSGESQLDASQALNAGGGGGGGLFSGGTENTLEDDEGEGEGQLARLLDIIRNTVERDSWQESGGGDASLREFNGQLIVYNTSDAQRQVADLLEQLRATRALQISVETRFLSVTSNFLEEFGVDLDFVFNAGTAGIDRAFTPAGAAIIDPFTGAPVLIPRQNTAAGFLPAIPALGVPLAQQTVAQPFGTVGAVPAPGGIWPQWDELTPVTAQQGSLALVNPSQYNTGVPGSFASRAANSPALNIAGTFLDNLQIDFLIRATQANARSSVVQAPRLVLFNGQRSRINVGRRRDYVSSVRPQLAEGAVGVQPIVAQSFSGTELIVDGTISADRRYVTLTIITSQADDPRFERFEIQRPSGNSPGIFIQLLDQTTATISTTVSIPDGGTVLLGGVKQVGEIEVEAGVPVLSKIPVLKRAFNNDTSIKDTRTLLILVKAKIIIPKEAEEMAFPTFALQG
jgi:general secretion pathway protein D